jgi:predicted ATPase/class 3 adenylate cyclase
MGAGSAGGLGVGALPEGTVTFLFTDLEGSTRLLQAHPHAYRDAARRHHDLLRAAVEAQGGAVFETVGDAVYAAFARPTAAVAAALEGQRALQQESWAATGPLRARMGVHLGEVERQGAHYFGAPLYRCARLTAAAHGEQVVLSQAAADLVGDALPAAASLRDLGEHRLKDLARPERVYQLVHPDLPRDFPPLRSLDLRPHNLPVQPTPFVGRAADVAAVRRRVLQAVGRLLTLTGPGGTGKTRLALQAAAEALDDFPDGVWLVALAAISDPGLVPGAIARTLGVREVLGEPLSETLGRHLESKRLLLVLDNFEQVVAAAPVVAGLLDAAPGLRALVTSRAALRLAAEREYPVAPLALPDPTRPPAPEALTQCEAVALFVQRALAVKPGFGVTQENAPAVAAICARVDGLPLALELAAARVKLLPPRALLARLDRRLPLLTGGVRDAPARQRTLRATLDWSHDLLAPPERALFARLAVFVGGFTLEAAEAVCRPGGGPGVDVLDGLAALADQSLLRQDEQPGSESRFSMLETLREYAAERLDEAGQADDLRRRHAEFYLALAEQVGPRLRGYATRLEQAEREHDNFRAALAWLVARGPAEAALRLATALGPFWAGRGHLREGRRWLDAALALAPAPGVGEGVAAAVRARALRARAGLAGDQGDFRAGRAAAAESLALCRAAGDRPGAALALGTLAHLEGESGDAAAAQEHLEELLVLGRALGDEERVAFALNGLGNHASRRGDLPRARALYEESLALRRGLGRLDAVARTLMNLGDLAAAEGDSARAAARYEESLELSRALGERLAAAGALAGLGDVLSVRGDVPAAMTRWREALALHQALGNRPMEAAVLASMGRGAYRLGDLTRAAALLEQSLAIWRELAGGEGATPDAHSRYDLAQALYWSGLTAQRRGDLALARRYYGEILRAGRENGYDSSCQSGLCCLALLAAQEGDLARAAGLLGAVTPQTRAVQRMHWPDVEAEAVAVEARARAALGEEAFERAWQQGRSMGVPQAVADALEDARGPV